MNNKDTQVKIPIDVVSPYKQPVYSTVELQGQEKETKAHEKNESKAEKKSEY
jgi:hypothetical protein